MIMNGWIDWTEGVEFAHKGIIAQSHERKRVNVHSLTLVALFVSILTIHVTCGYILYVTTSYTPMNQSTSQSEAKRQQGKHQVDEQRTSILEAAETLFLQSGLEKTTMVEIAAAAGITKVTLYRYFPNRDMIALEIQVRMMDEIAALVDPGLVESGQVDLNLNASTDPATALRSVKTLAQSMIRNFAALRDAYRYMGMFDQLYLDNPTDAALSQWTKNQLLALPWKGAKPSTTTTGQSHGDRLGMILSTVVWFLEKLALRGELTWSDQSIPLEEHLKLFEEMIVGYIEKSIEEIGRLRD